MTVALLAVVGAGDSAVASKSVSVRGVFRAIHAQDRSGDATLYSLEADGGRLYALRIDGAHRRTSSGARVEVRGELEGDVITVTSLDELSSPKLQAATTGSRKILVINAVWDGASLRGTQEQEHAFLFGTTDSRRRSMRQYYEDVSYGQLSLDGSETTTLTIPYPGGCPTREDSGAAAAGIANAADAAASNAGYDLSDYSNTIYSTPALPGCAAGYGELGGSRVWMLDASWDMNEGYARLVAAHEFGHNLGQSHGHGLECGSAILTSACLASASSIDEYGAAYDVMGNNTTGNAYGAVNWMALPHQLKLGWLAPANRVVTARYPGPTQTVGHVIQPIENPTGTVGVVVDTPAHRYYIEARSPVGQDSFLSNWPSATSGVLISMRNDIPGTRDDGPLSLDAHPGSAADSADFQDAALRVGESFTDEEALFTLTVDSITTSGAEFHITPAVAVPDAAPPDTTIVSGPSGTTSSGDASFEFSSSEAGSTFECKQDGDDWAQCSSPKAVTGLPDGLHTFSVRARDAAGETDSSPAIRSWRVARPSPAPRPPEPTPRQSKRPAQNQVESALGADLAAVVKDLRRQGIGKLVRRRGFTARGLDALLPGSFHITLTGTRRGAGTARKLILAQGTRSFSKAASYAFKVKLTRHGRRLLRNDRRVRITLTITFRDTTGQATTKHRALGLRR